MRFAFTEDQRLLAKALRDLLGRECDAARVRDAWSRDDGRVPGLWDRLAELGVVGATVPTEYGGMGLDELDLVLLMEEAGRAACPEPLIETTAVAVPLLRDIGESGLFGRIGAEKAVIVVALGPYIAHAGSAERIIAERDGALYAVDDAALVRHPSVDGSRRLYSMTWEHGTAIADGELASTALQLAIDRGALATAAALSGAAGHLLEVTVEYAKTRQQFGKPIGGFQAVKHHLANALLRLELCRPLVYRAAYSMAHQDGDRAVHVSMAKAAAADASAFVAKIALQVHGAIGYSYELDLHLWLKRVWSLASDYGDANWHRARVGHSMGVEIGERA